MKKQIKLIMFFVFLIIILGSIYIFKTNNSFKNTVLENIRITDVTIIEIIRSADNKEIVITDRNQIDKIMSNFLVANLKKSKILDQNFNESYWIKIRVNKKLKLGLRLDDKNYISVFDYDKGNIGDFKINGNFEKEIIENLFE